LLYIYVYAQHWLLELIVTIQIFESGIVGEFKMGVFLYCLEVLV
jgi:hypothetical protein